MARAYRIYLLGADDHIKIAHVLDCATDEEALVLAARELADEHALEIWDRNRFIGRLGKPFDPFQKPPARP